jgi:hypothetical protein
MLLVLSTSSSAAAFDWDRDNALIWLVAPYEVPAIYKISPGGNEASIVLRITTLLANAWFDAIAPYHPTAVGVYSRLGRRPASESQTNRNKNIALMYASFSLLNRLLPQDAKDWRTMMQAAGLDPNNTSTDLTSPVGIGNAAGMAVAAARLRDGMNQLGDMGGKKYNLKPYEDYTGYKPVNSPYELIDPGRWSPLFAPKVGGPFGGLYAMQKFELPQWALTTPYTVSSVKNFTVPQPVSSNPANFALYKQQVDQVLAASAALTDPQKAMAELFDNKVISLGALSAFVNLLRGATLDQYVYERFVSGVAAFDAGIVTWKEKVRYDAVRPNTAIEYLYGDHPVTAWGGPGKGTVTDIPGSEWRPYLNQAAHPEYPSGSACFCAAHAQASRRFWGTDQLGIIYPVPPGSSGIEPGKTPAGPVFLYWGTWTEFVHDCGMSRNWGGVHFLASLEAGWNVCRQFGDKAFDMMTDLINGKPRDKQ